MQGNQFTPMICKNCGTEDSDTIPGDSDLQDVECNRDISGPDISPCDPCKELASLEKIMARLVKRRSELKRNINRIHSPLIRRIPSEIIAKISEFATTGSVTDLTIMGTSSITLSSICSDWRQIVVKTPQLWSSINIRLPFVLPNHDIANSRLATFIEEWLARSGQLPLHISISSRSGGCGASGITDSNTPEKYLTIFNILNRYSSRWRTLNISIPPTLFSYLQPDCLSLLEQLHINVESQSDHMGIHDYLIFPPSQHLRAVGIARTSINFGSEVPLSLSNFRIQWDNVTHMSAERLTVRESLKLLRLIPRLVHGEFHILVSFILEEKEEAFPESPIRTPLRYLSLSSPQGYLCDSNFFDNLLLPCLETLVLSDIASSMDSLITCLKRSACSLHTLSLENLWVSAFHSLIRLLQLLSPSLEKLELADANPNSSYYLSILTKIYSSQSAMGNNILDDFLPHLEIFKFGKGFSSSNSESTNTLPNLPTPSYPRPATLIPLRSVHIDSNSIPKPIPPDVLSLFQHLSEDGIVVMFE